jgi:predicted permease
MSLFRRLRRTISGSKLDEDIAEEMRFHLDERIDEYVKSGMTYEQARLKAHRRLRNLTLAREQARDVDTVRWLGDLRQDVRYALRQLRRNPGFALAAVLTLALGIGTTTAVFSVVDAVVFRPLSYADSTRLVMIDEWIPSVGAIPVNAVHFLGWQKTARSFVQIALVGPLDVNVTDSNEPERLPAARVSSELFPMLGVRPELGRVFLADDDVPGRDRVVVITSELWRRRYSADPQMVGRTISINGVAHEVVGVLPTSFHFPRLSHLYPVTVVQDRPQIWKPLGLRPEELRNTGDFNFVSIGRLKAGVSVRQAASELDAVQKDFSAEMPKSVGPDLRTQVLPLKDRIVGRAKTGLNLMLTAVGVVLFIGCVNITNLLLSRLSWRRRELAVRSAIGASRWRLIRQMVVESLTLSAVAGACGASIAYGAIRLILVIVPADVPRLDEVHVDARILMFTLIISGIAGLVIGVSPAWQFGNADAGDAIASRAPTASRGTGRIRFVLVSSQIALSTVCLIAAGLLLHSLVNLLNVDRGFDTNHIMTVGANLPNSRYPTPEKRIEFVRTAMDRLKVLPGAIDVAAANMLPMAGEGGNSALRNASTKMPLFEQALGNIRTVNSDYFRAMGMSLQGGRFFSDADRERQVAVISMSIAKRAWPGEDPVGKRFHFGPPTAPDREVIGVVNDVRGVSLEAGPSFSVYIPYWQWVGPYIGTSFAVKTTQDPMAIVPAIRAVIRSIDAELPLSTFRTMEEVVEGSVAQRRFQTNLVLAFGVAAMLLASLGVYAVMSFAVTQRTTEIGIRLALGAERGAVLRMVLRQALRPVAVGVAAAVPLALGAGSWIRSLLFGVSPQDPATIAVVCLALITVAMLAAYLPARRAANLDPLTALRYE